MARSQARWSARALSAYWSSSSKLSPWLPGPDTWSPSFANGYDTGLISAQNVGGVHHGGWLVTVRLLVMLMLLACPAVGRAADEVVDDCSSDAELRAKLASMQSGEGGTLTFACGASSEIELTADVLAEIFRPTTIDGGGAITLNGRGRHQIFQVDFSGSLTLKHIRLTNAASGLGGAAVVNAGALALEDVEISNSEAGPLGRGGAIYSTFSSHSLTITNSRLVGNRAGSGGAIFADNTFAPVTITNSLLRDNHAYGDEPTNGWGGAILLLGSEAFIEGGEIRDNDARTGGAIVGWELSNLVIHGTTILANRALNGPGGGLRLGEGPGSNVRAVLTDVTLYGNKAEGGALAFPTGGGVHCDGCSLEIERSTLAVNRATNRGGGLYLTSPGPSSRLVNVTIAGNSGGSFGGGGIYLNNGAMDLTNVTVVANSAGPGSGGGIASFNGSVGLRNVVLVNFNDNCRFVSPVGTPVKDSNLSSDRTCSFGSSRDDVTIPNSNVLKENGGPTQTVLFDADSPTVDRGTPNGCPPTDQRGAPRPFGTSCDVGATEFGADTPISCGGDCNGDGTVAISELIAAVNVALGSAAYDTCADADADRSGAVAINDLITAVNAALGGCVS